MGFEIKIISFGTRKDLFIDEIDRYVKMTRPFAPLSLEFLKSTITTGYSRDAVLDQEEKQIRAKIIPGSYVVVLGEEGREFTSTEFSKWLAKRRETAPSLSFIIGNAYGVSPTLKRDADEVISLSQLTMPYSMALLVLSEQIYRAYTIFSGHPYSK